MSVSALGGLTAASYVPHALHRGDRAWPETNCYADLWIEVLHAAGLEPLASLAFTLAVDFEGDQWTFFKPSHAELERLYGLDVQELNLWRPLEAHALEQLGRGNLVLAEMDAFHLPDTAGTDYRRQHTKTTVAIHHLDPEGRRLGYFHNAGAFELAGEDYDALFRHTPAAGTLPTYVEFVKLARKARHPDARLHAEALALLAHHVARAPVTNPFEAFGVRFLADVELLKSGALPDYHLYAFATLRQVGAAFELAAYFLRWLEAGGASGLTASAERFHVISQTSKSMVLKLARAVTTRRAVDFAPMLSELALAWSAGMEPLRSRAER